MGILRYGEIKCCNSVGQLTYSTRHDKKLVGKCFAACKIGDSIIAEP